MDVDVGFGCSVVVVVAVAVVVLVVAGTVAAVGDGGVGGDVVASLSLRLRPMIVSRAHSICTHRRLTTHHLSFCTDAVDRTPRFQLLSTTTKYGENTLNLRFLYTTPAHPRKKAYVRLSCEFEGATLFGATVCFLVWLILRIGHQTFASLQSSIALIVEDLSAA